MWNKWADGFWLEEKSRTYLSVLHQGPGFLRRGVPTCRRSSHGGWSGSLQSTGWHLQRCYVPLTAENKHKHTRGRNAAQQRVPPSPEADTRLPMTNRSDLSLRGELTPTLLLLPAPRVIFIELESARERLVCEFLASITLSNGARGPTACPVPGRAPHPSPNRHHCHFHWGLICTSSWVATEPRCAAPPNNRLCYICYFIYVLLKVRSEAHLLKAYAISISEV